MLPMRTTSSTASNVASGEAPEHVFYDAQLRDSKERVVEAPEFGEGVQIADTHAHLDMLHYPGLALARAAANKVSFVVSIIDPTEDPAYTLNNVDAWFSEAQDLLVEWGANKDSACSTCEPSPVLAPPEVRIIMGCHPHNASSYTQEVEDTLVAALNSNKRVVGIGEIGLDYHYDNSPRTIQQEVFRRQIQLAHEHDCTIALHLREAHEDGLKILKEEGLPPKGVLLHCFNLDYATLEPFLELGLMVAYGGPLTFKKCDDVRDSALHVPLNKLVTETDCPFMAPVPIRGTVCEPASVVFTAQLLADIKSTGEQGEEKVELLKAFYGNARSFFCR